MPTVLLPVPAGPDQENRLRRTIAAAEIAQCINVRPWPAYRSGRADTYVAAERSDLTLGCEAVLVTDINSLEYLLPDSITQRAAKVDLGS